MAQQARRIGFVFICHKILSRLSGRELGGTERQANLPGDQVADVGKVKVCLLEATIPRLSHTFPYMPATANLTMRSLDTGAQNPLPL
jgi:hypothetical protein